MLRLLDENDRFTVRDDELGVDSGDPDVSYEVRPLTRDDYKRQFKAHTKRSPNGRGGMEATTDVAALNEALLDACLVGWSGLTFRGESAPCTLEMKLRLDPERVQALLKRAGLNQIVAADEDRRASFRAPA